MSFLAFEVRGLLRSTIDAASGACWSSGAVGVQEGWLEGQAPPPQQPWDRGPSPPLPDRAVLTAWFDDGVNRATVLAAVRPWLDAHTSVSWRLEPDVDWEAQSRASFTPIQVGSFVVAPPWDAPPGALIVDPGAGFGTGDHPTTRQALLLFDEAHPAGSRVGSALDIGCGSGVLALAANRRGWSAHGTDIDPAAIANAEHNNRLNGLSATFDLRRADQLGQAELVFANLHAELLVELASDLLRLARQELILAGILAAREPAVRAALPWPVAERRVDGEWVALRLLRPA